MSVIAFIDPGSAKAGPGCAVAVFAYAHLVAAVFERTQSGRDLGLLRGLSRVVVERPVTQGSRTRAARPQDLMALSWAGALLAGALAGRSGCPIVELPASDADAVRGWKGSEPKPMQHARAWAVLSSAERDVLGGARVERTILAAREKGALDRWGKSGVAYYPKAFVEHNLLDAAAMGLTYLGRIERVG